MSDLFEPAVFRDALKAWLDDNDLAPPEDHSLQGHTGELRHVPLQ